MTRVERRATAGLASIYALRMLGLFMVLPVFAVFAETLRFSTPVLAGLAIGAYGIGQAMFQIPFGIWSDRWGRKQVITVGLLIFAVGSMVAALAPTIWWAVAGRFLQGCGAVSAVAMALTADFTRDSQRTKAMAVIGMSIGLSFAVSMVAAPILAGWIGVRGIFWSITGLSGLAIVALYTLVPAAPPPAFQRDALPAISQLGTVLRNPDLLRLDFGILALHAMVTAVFTVLPLVLRDQFQFPAPTHWQIYLPVMVGAILAMIPLVAYAEIKRRIKVIFLLAVLLLGANSALLWWYHTQWLTFVVALFLFFTGFNVLEATLPSLISKSAPPHLKGTAMGVYGTAQFLGAFLGSAGAGWVHGQFGKEFVFLYCALWAIVWLAVASGMRPRYLKTLKFPVDEYRLGDPLFAAMLCEVRGVEDVAVIAEEAAVYLKVDRNQLDSERLNSVLAVRT